VLRRRYFAAAPLTVTVTFLVVRPDWFVDSGVSVVVAVGVITTPLPRTAPTCGVMMLYSEWLTAHVSVTTWAAADAGFAPKLAMAGGAPTGALDGV